MSSKKHVSILAGSVFSRLTVVRNVSRSRYECLCQCGNICVVMTSHLTLGNKGSCGCRKLEAGRENGLRNKVHGLSHKPTGISWSAMMERCYRPNARSFPSYASRGMFVCEFLRESPRNLLNLIGERPAGKTLDREDNDGFYTCGSCNECKRKGLPLNVRWATLSQQNRNRRDSRFLTIGGVEKHVRQWAEENNLNASCIFHRIEAGLSGLELLRPSRSLV